MQKTSLIKMWQEKRVLYTMMFVHLWQYLAEFFLEWEMFLDKSCSENQNTFYVQNFFLKIIPFMI